ncbi:MAG TPA: GspH/FimT family pseudopilin [Marinagarivorans sp.]
MGSSRYQQATGFTLLELMVTISIMAIIAGIAVPSYQGLIQNNQLRAASHAFYGSLVLARSEAVKNNLPVAMCKSTDSASCAGSGTWDDGWLIYIDADNDGSLDSGEMILDSHSGLQNLTLRATDANLHQLIYQPDGTQRVATHFNVCIDDDASRGSKIAIGLTGRPSAEKGATTCP